MPSNSGNTTTSGNTFTSGDTIKNDSSKKENDSSQDNTTTSAIFNLSNLVIGILFLVVYLIIYYGLGIFYGSESTNQGAVASKIFDFFVLGCIIFFIISKMLVSNTNEISTELKSYWDSFVQYIDSPISTIFLVIFIILFYTIVYMTGIPMTSDTKSIAISVFENAVWITIVIGVFVNFFKYVLGISIVNVLSSFSFDTTTETKQKEEKEEKETPSTPPPPKDEVFNITNNLYTYEDARAVCKSYGARLATYDEIEQAYEDGAEWCNYGWSQNQMGFFPTQKSTWEELQKDPKKKNNCGRPGVNGGYFANPYIRFGVNCYGKKPQPTEADLNAMKKVTPGVPPLSDKDKELEAKMNFFKQNASDFMKISSFNANKWSENST
jgi:hypothetical protein